MKAKIITRLKHPRVSKFQDIHITNHCQLDCKHCYLYPKNKTHMPVDMFTKIIDDFTNTRHPVLNTNVILSGGEPLQHPFIKYMFEYLRYKGRPVLLSSNGLLIPDYIHCFKPGDGIQISIDGDQETHDYIRGEGTYTQAANALCLLRDHGINHSVTMAVSKENSHAIDSVIKLCKNTNTPSLNLTPFQPHPSTSLTPLPFSKWLSILSSVRKHTKTPLIPKTCVEGHCMAGILGYSILPDGTYWDCSRNQKTIGRYPLKVENCLAWDLINNEKAHSSLVTCCKKME